MTSQDYANEHELEVPDSAAQTAKSDTQATHSHKCMNDECCCSESYEDADSSAVAEGLSDENVIEDEKATSQKSDGEESNGESLGSSSAESESLTQNAEPEQVQSMQTSSETDEEELTPLGKAKQEAMEYLEALQRERADFLNFRNRVQKEQVRFREHGIIDVLTALLPALDDIDRIREFGEMDESFQAVSAKIDKVFEKFGVHKFGEKGETFDPTQHDAILHKSDPDVQSETVDTVVEAGYRIGDRVIRAARVVVSSPSS